MAQKRDKEETELKFPICTPPQTIPPPPAQPQQIPPSAARSDPKASSGACDPRTSSASSPDPEVENPNPDPKRAASLKRPREVTRCSGPGCRKRIGLMGFRCRCGDVFCSEHRYSDRHECSYDYKAAGREAIARENPVVRAAKLLKV